MLTIRKETPSDYRVVENLTREAFWNVYKPGCDEHLVLHQFRTRDDFLPELSLVMELDGEIIGHVMYAKAVLRTDAGTDLPIMTFGPISIAPKWKRQGFGKKLLDYSLAKAKEMGCGAICILGNFDFYGKSGFEIAGKRGIYHEGMPREELPFFLVKEIQDGYLDGVTGTFSEPDGYCVTPEALEAFEREFPAKEKLKLPGQLRA